MNRSQVKTMASAESWDEFHDLVRNIEASGATGLERDRAIWKAYYTVNQAYASKVAYISKLGRCIQ